ncbi:MAG: MerR family transcriptional regulator [Candidatus Omnitrophota bacterium]|nr:MerR family transcriptional regulator [Candidatus Omnitrophota bacterium]MBU1929812.1 MerR family transcriptional regulator [Candidatus Omnitrophota bacterium]MBU2035186.1 MerR family transcriptional regulator [Candidatus Omnitrophota bacterium]MBU2221342.1 MerR family transcriptional regulator [Candidatus Omnitrophota bacterium]MBU2258377.1 MerR family transcriptional regulator [Candidatus Omnitrophota bacterium]
MPIFDIQISPDEPVYVISVTSRLVDLPVWTLRQLDKAGIVCPKRIGKKSRLYCLKDVKRLEYIHYLMEEKQVNIKGIKIILEIEHQE